MRDHVIYESRLELARLLLIDFDPAVHRVLAQPFLLKVEVGGKVRKHIPDYLLLTASGPEVVDVKPRCRLAKPDVAFTFGWTRDLVEARGWKYTVWSEPEPAWLENIRFLAGYRRSELLDPALLASVQAVELDGTTLAEALTCLPSEPEPLVRAAVLHLLWSGRFTTDLDRPLSSDHVLRVTR